jgi:hypothetical protein
MQKVLILVAGGFLLFGAQVKADDEFDLFPSEEVSDTEEAAAKGWSKWVCSAKSGWLRSYKGESYYFREASGESADAKRIARLMAERSCEVRAERSCLSRESDCKIERL